jgi:hypothetical protein
VGSGFAGRIGEDLLPKGGGNFLAEVAAAAQGQGMQVGEGVRKGRGTAFEHLEEGQRRGIAGRVGKKLIGGEAPRWLGGPGRNPLTERLLQAKLPALI